MKPVDAFLIIAGSQRVSEIRHWFGGRQRFNLQLQSAVEDTVDWFEGHVRRTELEFDRFSSCLCWHISRELSAKGRGSIIKAILNYRMNIISGSQLHVITLHRNIRC